MSQEAASIKEETGEVFFVYQQDTNEIPTDVVRLLTDSLVQEFPKHAFRYCHALVEVTLSEGLRHIADSAFFDCRALKRVSIPSTVKKTGKRSFHLCTSLVDVSLKKEGLVSIEDSAFGCCKALQTIKIPSSVTIIEKFAFGSCTSLANVEFQEGLQILGSQSFQSCAALQEVNVPTSVIKIEWGAFRGCHQLRFVELPKKGYLEQLDADTFARCYSLTSISIPSNITSMEASFSNCKSLVDVELVPGLESILDRAFENCKALTVVQLPSTLKEIGKRAFSGCEGLSEIHFPKGLVRIRTTAFFGCSSLSAVAFPPSLQVIEKLAFGSCMSLLGVEFPNYHNVGSNLQLQGAVFHKCVRLVNLSFPPSMKDLSAAGDVLFLGCDRLNDWNKNKGILVKALQERYHGLMVHQACYASSSTSVDDLVKVLSLSSSAKEVTTKDCFGMTAFHIVATSFRPRTDILGALLDKYGTNALHHQDVHGNTMMDYMLLHHSPRIIPLIQMLLQTTMVASLSNGWGLEEWKMTILGYLDELSKHDDILRKIRDQITLYVKLEMTSLLELALWKMKHKEMRTTAPVLVNEERCRLLCGANVVIPQVVAYLWGNDGDNSTSSLELPFSVFPFDLSKS